MLRRNKLQVVGGKVHAILHHHAMRGPELAHIDGHAHWLAAIGADTLVLSAIPERTPAAAPASASPLTNAEWAHLLHLVGSVEHVCARHRLKLAVQPRFGSTIQDPEQIERLLVGSEAGVCLDIAHLVIAGADPVEVVELTAGRIQHVHLNDVDGGVAQRVREGSLEYREAIARGLYKPIGEGAARVDRVIDALRATGYRAWYTLEQETRLATADDRPLGRVSRSLEYVLPLLA
jgi:inosose dehydratase